MWVDGAESIHTNDLGYYLLYFLQKWYTHKYNYDIMVFFNL